MASPTMAELIKQRGWIKGSITRALNYAVDPPQNYSVEDIKVRINRLEKLWSEFVSATYALSNFSDDPDYVNPNDDYVEYEEKYLTASGQYNDLLIQCAPREETVHADHEDSIARLIDQQTEFLSRFSSTTVVATREGELPKIRIPTFSGVYKDWISFRDLFISSIDSKTTLTDTQKFHYLKSLLSDDAAKLVQHIPVSNSAYRTAWTRLNDRYNRPRHIINSFIESFMNLPSTTLENASTLRSMSDGANEIIRGLDAAGHVDRDIWLIHILTSKLDPISRQRWIQHTRDQASPSLDDFFGFMDNRCEELELTVLLKDQNTTKSFEKSRSANQPRTRSYVTQAGVKSPQACIKCNSSDHSIMKCNAFISMPVDDRRTFTKDKSLCFNCLKLGHNSTACKSKFRCQECNRRHHTHLHISPQTSSTDSSHQSSLAVNSTHTASSLQNNAASLQPSHSGAPWSTVSHIVRSPRVFDPLISEAKSAFTAMTSYSKQQTPLLPTALVDIRAAQGRYITCRVLLDCASELSYVTERCRQVLGLSCSSSRILVSGITDVQGETTRGCCTTQIKSKVTSYEFSARLHVLNKITTNLPTTTIKPLTTNQLHGLSLADPSYHVSSAIDVLLGAEYVWNIFTFDKIYDPTGKTVAISSTLGWVITGSPSKEQKSTNSFVSLMDIDNSLRRFWEIEEVHNSLMTDPENEAVENHFSKTHSRSIDGKYIVRLPFKTNPTKFGETFHGALSRFNSVEKRLLRNDELRKQYTLFMREYEALGHMRELQPHEISDPNNSVFYLPHHPVIGKKLRVVFDGSFKDSTGRSLNDSLYIGPSLQRNLFVVCLRFRMHKFVFSADIVKMFRQIWVAQDERNFQRIVWREDNSQPIKHYQLCTVTYGTTCAPFLAVRVLEQLAHDYKDKCPDASAIVMNDFYVDDVLTGSDSEEDLIRKRDELNNLMSYAGLKLDKWVSNSNRIENQKDKFTQLEFVKDAESSTKKVLGIYWSPYIDMLGFNISIDLHAAPTKRQVLSDVARIFDPLGLLAPIVIQLKILFQELWLLNLQWDDQLPQNLMQWWTNARLDLQNITKLSLPRYVPNFEPRIELHGFSDASTKAYSAVVYCRSTNLNGDIAVTLISSKTRVAPLKQHSIPRLELCGARELARLISIIMKALSHKNITTIAWCDSTVVLSWLSRPPSKLKPFVANRCSEILDTLPRNCWHHVSSKDNPADCASRGLMTSDLIKHQLWWKGPEWLQNEDKYQEIINDSNKFNRFTDPEAESEARQPTINLLSIEQEETIIALLSKRFSSWWKLIRAVAYWIRFVEYLRYKKSGHFGSLQYDEINLARTLCIKHAQDDFKEEKNHLQRYKELNSKSKLQSLCPFIDDKGIIRVGGRICNTMLAQDTQHPIIMPKNHHITLLIMQEEHEKYLHPGVSALFFILRQKYWIIGARNMIRKLTFNCLKCFRLRHTAIKQKMADMPSVRVRQAFPFQHTGCDYAGPLQLKLYKGRNAKTSKGYICVFVCMATSAIHLELSTDLTTETFLASFRRFISRRGKCSNVYSDNGRNFVGASKTLDEMYKILYSQQHNNLVTASLAKDGIQWNYIPPHSPHWGGIWESAVRSVKLHLRRVIGDSILTFEQMNTLLTQIEAVVNSRPLGATTDSETNYLSPSHFLIGRPYTMVPEGDITGINSNKLDYWQNVQNMMQGFWRRWHTEYLTSLQNRSKWSHPNINIGDVVILKEQNLPPAKWPIAKIIQVYPGKDGLIRVAKLRTAQGEITRPITRFAILPNF